MFWMVVGFILSVGFGLVWFGAFYGGNDDARALRDYERARREFERWFE